MPDFGSIMEALAGGGNYPSSNGSVAPMPKTPFDVRSKQLGFPPGGRVPGPTGGFPGPLPQASSSPLAGRTPGPTGGFPVRPAGPQPLSTTETVNALSSRKPGPTGGFPVRAAAPNPGSLSIAAAAGPTPGQAMEALHGGNYRGQMAHDALMSPAAKTAAAAAPASPGGIRGAVRSAAAGFENGALTKGLAKFAPGLAKGALKAGGLGVAAEIGNNPEQAWRMATGGQQAGINADQTIFGQPAFSQQIRRAAMSIPGSDGKPADPNQSHIYDYTLGPFVGAAANAGQALGTLAYGAADSLAGQFGYHLPGGEGIRKGIAGTQARVQGFMGGKGDPGVPPALAASNASATQVAAHQETTSTLAASAPKSPDAPATTSPTTQGQSSPGTQGPAGPIAAASPAPDQLGQALESQLRTRWGSRGGMQGGPAIYRSGQLTPDDHSLFDAINQHQGAMAHALQGQAAMLGAKADWAKTPAGMLEHPMGPAMLDSQLQAGGQVEGKAAAAGYGPRGQVPAGPAGEAYIQQKYPDMPTSPEGIMQWQADRKARGIQDDDSLSAAIRQRIHQQLSGDEFQGWQQPGWFENSDAANQRRTFAQSLGR